MKKAVLSMAILMSSFAFAQTVSQDTTATNNQQRNAAQNILNGNGSNGITVGGYAQVDYNQPEGANGKMDVHRLVMLLGYKFSDKVQFVTEIEYEHVKEVYVEQAFLNYSVSDNFNVRGGLMLVPMGIVNEYHEPTTFNGVERPSMDKSIVPTTWREMGVGVTGKFDDANLRYQAYIFNGFASVNDTKVLGGSNGLRNGRQKGAESTINKPNLSAKVDYYGVQGLRLGLSGYFGRTQATDDVQEIDGADVGVSMLGLDARYINKRFSARGQYIHALIKDAEDYNNLYTTNLGSELKGWYAEAAYNLLPLAKEQKLDAFVRYEKYDTHAATADANITRNLGYNRNEWTTGLSYHVAPGAVVKADYQIFDNAVEGNDAKGQLNIGFGVWF
ncbi:OprO/OprP family phosphate-selective porin [Flavobacteriaceae bacterium S0825]|uniref:hypothetical protein n=1 Tax=Gaetbulibacter sp. S0825 TaxID=2720084 RepID=UPI001430BDA6|nr:hypothetical protein [Gaetbulibacter sp. S0825]MCK0109083.1 OprO/OprP family phosphate-selective porin [Flavobacteriaceae bacterium S0825]NIX64718.1 hypothetical protein [Gaetbulibacter sp. S0825]